VVALAQPQYHDPAGRTSDKRQNRLRVGRGEVRQEPLLRQLLAHLAPNGTMGYLEALRPGTRRLNAALIVAGGRVRIIGR
jgi:hypothetical protein